MDDAAGVRVGDALRDGRQQRDLVPQPRAVRAAPHVDRRPLHQLHRDPRHLAAEGRAGVHGVDLGHAGVLQPREHLGLVGDALAQALVGAGRAEHLQGDGPSRARLLRLVHRAGAAEAQQAPDREPRDGVLPEIHRQERSPPLRRRRVPRPRGERRVRVPGEERRDLRVEVPVAAAGLVEASRREAPRDPTRSYTTRARASRPRAARVPLSGSRGTYRTAAGGAEMPSQAQDGPFGRTGSVMRGAAGPAPRSGNGPAGGVRDDVRLEDLPWARTTTISPWCDAPRPARPRRSEG
jgi:hypothetical protein